MGSTRRVYILETPPPPLPSRGGISPNGNWAENMKRGREKRGKCEGIERKNKDKGDVQKGKKCRRESQTGCTRRKFGISQEGEKYHLRGGGGIWFLDQYIDPSTVIVQGKLFF